ncbi:hypothetical protein QM262_22785 [Enterobacter hormaechei]|uniref:hypothetical protein n=1 Tax=Enterobacter hormaechei TaxID=158836 RepID=UPI0029490DE6|nr:hypothetical protein [Enterobacter hormaechei]MDV5821869.1 hypothetical protein [Enterobacter hormaechei]
MSEFYSRAATVADMPFIMGEFEDGARKGHFYEEILTSKGVKPLRSRPGWQSRQTSRVNTQGILSTSCCTVLMTKRQG